MSDGYLAVPVATARAIADEFAKDAIVILALDRRYKRTHTITYGRTPFDKENAAAVGELVTKAIGCDLAKKQSHEDFHRSYDAAEFAAAKERISKLERACQAAEHALNSLLACRAGATDALLTSVRDACTAALITDH